MTKPKAPTSTMSARHAAAWRFARLALVAVLLPLCRCGSVRITIQADAETNQGRPLQVLVRSVDEETYRGESYWAVSRLVTTSASPVLHRMVIDPRSRYERTFSVKAPKDRPLAVYFLFTTATGPWKLLLLPRLPWSVTIPLRRHGIAHEWVKERRCPFSSVTSASSGASSPSAPSAPTLPTTPSLPTAPSAPTAPPPPTLPSAPAPPPAPPPPSL